MRFEIVSEIENIETIAEGSAVRVRFVLAKRYGKGRWKKKKGTATGKFRDGSFRLAEVHWHGARGIGIRDMKTKFPFLD